MDIYYNDVVKTFLKRFSVIQWVVIVLALAINIFIIVNACLPSSQSTKESNWIVEPAKTVINTIKADTINETNIGDFSSFIRKFVGHFSLFMVSGFLTTLSIKFIHYDLKKKFWIFIIISSISGLFLAILTEFIQLFVPGRSGEVLDVLIDFSGYLIVVIIIGLILFIKNKKSSKVEKETE